MKRTMQESVAVEDVQSDGHNCDVALRKIVTQALAGVPKESFLKSLSNLIQSVGVCVCESDCLGSPLIV